MTIQPPAHPPPPPGCKRFLFFHGSMHFDVSCSQYKEVHKFKVGRKPREDCAAVAVMGWVKRAIQAEKLAKENHFHGSPKFLDGLRNYQDKCWTNIDAWLAWAADGKWKPGGGEDGD